jgi:hypothetical protein
MAALTQKRMHRDEAFRTISLPLTSGQKVYQGGMACYDTAATGGLKKGAVSTTLVRIGDFAESADNTSGGAPNVNVRLEIERFGTWYDNVTGAGAVIASDIFGLAYIVDDHTVTRTSTGASVAGLIWDLDVIKGVLVEKVSAVASTA